MTSRSSCAPKIQGYSESFRVWCILHVQLLPAEMTLFEESMKCHYGEV
jgi:hypothetical protein